MVDGLSLEERAREDGRYEKSEWGDAERFIYSRRRGRSGDRSCLELTKSVKAVGRRWDGRAERDSAMCRSRYCRASNWDTGHRQFGASSV